jgi:copper(I)-binding protein
MLEGLRSDLRQGQHVVVVLTFARAGVVTLSATVSDVPGLTA